MTKLKYETGKHYGFGAVAKVMEEQEQSLSYCRTFNHENYRLTFYTMGNNQGKLHYIVDETKKECLSSIDVLVK